MDTPTNGKSKNASNRLPARAIKVSQADWDAWKQRAKELGVNTISGYLKLLVAKDLKNAAASSKRKTLPW